MSDSSHRHAIDCARRAADRTATIVHRKLGRGTWILRAIASIAPLLGMLGTAVLLIDALRYSSTCDYGDCAGGGSAEAFLPILLSLPVAIFACGAFHRLRHHLETFDLEMRTATIDLLNGLARQSH